MQEFTLVEKGNNVSPASKYEQHVCPFQHCSRPFPKLPKGEETGTAFRNRDCLWGKWGLEHPVANSATQFGSRGTSPLGWHQYDRGRVTTGQAVTLLERDGSASSVASCMTDLQDCRIEARWERGADSPGPFTPRDDILARLPSPRRCPCLHRS